MSELPRILDTIGRLLSYPDSHTVQSAELLFVLFHGELPEAAGAASEFGAFVESQELYELEETYSRTFDINPACALEIGWHLFGEEYARGLFLVRLRAEMQMRGLEESAELPDHIVHALAVVAAMDRDEAERFVGACVLPAVDKMHEKLVEAESPYRHVMRCLAFVLEDEFGREEIAEDETTDDANATTSQGDPLRDFPMPTPTDDSITFVPLHMNFNHQHKAFVVPDESKAADAERYDDSVPFMLRDKIRHGGGHG
ncbi:MAG: hypothetical protein DWQ31_20160 [Planctomycetota bacterium]|nr:MAG: hypothetical protein DWQ31_20160 [Planctomycetota bacterium]REJ96449.1 MAG: hypothetical protein DWQ35_04445 [Planctomycetota bacterium]REK25093.1 MAG: hypothetical protein DWQ42_12035 [Planctomycetota bacterium]REK44661.1 MAG: hypothetical protein DWQ46_08800 [Planctomycetota bacterium]